MVELPDVPDGFEVAIFAGGCFWCMEGPFDEVDGVEATVSGYTGGDLENPTYEDVTGGGTGHAEAVWILYDPAKVSYTQLLDVFWRQINPTTKNRQFCDVGDSYRTAIFTLDGEQKRLAETSRAQMAEDGPFDAPLVTEIEAAGPFWPAEEYHQEYYKKNPRRYKFYRASCGRDAYLEQIWSERSKES